MAIYEGTLGVACGLYKAHILVKSISWVSILLARRVLEFHLSSSQQWICWTFIWTFGGRK